ncbi:MAG: DUF445 family protein [Treponema sp.]|nr:DUF445 family protein [Treponema sp.]
MNNILIFIVPPIAGAFIGFVTNVIAIRMLFRPLGEIRVLKIRLPFTPGILPRQRHKLAQSIGSMVQRELLTPEILRERLARGDVREKVRKSISLFTEKILEKTPGELFEGRENILTDKISMTAQKVYPAFLTGLLQFLGRDEIKRELESKGRGFLRNIILQLNVFQRFFLSAGQYDSTLEEKMPAIISDLILNAENFLKEEKVKKLLTGAVTSSFSSMIGGQDKNIAGLLEIKSVDKEKLDDYIFDKLMTAADGQIENILASIDVKALVSDRIDSLDMLRVERIILDVMADQFLWIDIFGGILGFLIGLFQVTFTWFFRQ